MISWSLLKNVYLSEIKTDIEKYSDFPTETIKEEDIEIGRASCRERV